MIFSNKVYDALRIVQMIIPIVATLYAGLSAVWSFPLADEITKTAVVIEAFLSALLEISKARYNKPLDFSDVDE